MAPGSLPATLVIESPGGQGFPERILRIREKIEDSWCGAPCGTQGRESDSAPRAFKGRWHRRRSRTRFCREGQWQPQRAVPQPERRQAQPQPQLVGQRLEWQLPLPGRSPLSLFLPSFPDGSFACNLAPPSAKHPARFGKMLGEMHVSFIIEGLDIPRELQQELQQVNAAYAPVDERQLVGACRVASQEAILDCR